MTARAAVPFVLKRGDEAMTAATYESTTEAAGRGIGGAGQGVDGGRE